MKDLNIPRTCDNCRYAANDPNGVYCGTCTNNDNKFKLNPMFTFVYEQGVKDMSDAFRKIYSSPEEGGYSGYELNEIFPDRCDNSIFIPLAILRSYGPLGIIQNIQEYEENKNNLHVGDVVLFEDYPNPDIKGVVTSVLDNDEFFIMWANGRSGRQHKDNITKVQGEHIDLGDILKKLGGE